MCFEGALQSWAGGPLAEGRKISDAAWVVFYNQHQKTHAQIMSASSRVKKQGEDDVTRATTMDGTINIGTSGSLELLNYWHRS